MHDAGRVRRREPSPRRAEQLEDLGERARRCGEVILQREPVDELHHHVEVRVGEPDVVDHHHVRMAQLREGLGLATEPLDQMIARGSALPSDDLDRDVPADPRRPGSGPRSPAQMSSAFRAEFGR